MSLTKYRHADGGTYVIMQGPFGLSMKMEDGRWEPAILYRRVSRDKTGRWQYEGPNHFVTTTTRWAERFTEIGDDE